MCCRLLRRALVLVIAVSHCVGGEQVSIVFDDPDLSTVIPSEHGEFRLDAYKAAGNDRILQASGTSLLPRLQWFSLGEPKLVSSRDRRNASKEGVFDLNFDRVTLKVSTLTSAYRKQLAAVVRAKYGVEVSERQLMHLPLSSVRCEIAVRNDAGELFLLTGRAGNLQAYPIHVDFTAPKNSAGRRLLERAMTHLSDQLSVDCTFYSKGKESRVDTLTLSSERVSQLGIVDKLFGPADIIHVTREQLVALSSELYSVLSILDVYAMSQHDFSDAFVTGLLQQTTSSAFSDVTADDALGGLSTYTLRSDVTSNDIKAALSSLFSVKSVANRRKIVLNPSVLTAHGQRGGPGGLFGIRITTGDITSPAKSLDDQLTALNSSPDSDVRWQVDRSRLVPRAIRVAKLWRRSFKKSLRFDRIFRHVTEAPFVRTVRLEIGDTVQMETRSDSLASLQQEQQEEIRKLKSDVRRLSTQLQAQPKQDAAVDVQSIVEGLRQQLLDQRESMSGLEATVARLSQQKQQPQAPSPLLQQQQLAGLRSASVFHHLTTVMEKQVEQTAQVRSNSDALSSEILQLRVALRNATDMIDQVKRDMPSQQTELSYVMQLYETHSQRSFWRQGGYTELHFVSESGSLPAATALLSHVNVNVNAQGLTGWTALHHASTVGRVEMLLLLLDHGADVNAKSSDSRTPLHMASMEGRVDAVRVLLNRGAFTEAKDASHYDFTPLHWASENGHAQVAKALLDRGSLISARTSRDEIQHRSTLGEL